MPSGTVVAAGSTPAFHTGRRSSEAGFDSRAAFCNTSNHGSLPLCRYCHDIGFLHLGCALICWNYLLRL